MKICKNYLRYKGLRAPTCNNGKPCDACKKKFRTVITDRQVEFTLYPNFMSENIKFGHKGFRSEIARAFSGRSSIVTGYRGMNDYIARGVSHYPSHKILSIGCTTFEGIQYDKLKKWALA